MNKELYELHKEKFYKYQEAITKALETLNTITDMFQDEESMNDAQYAEFVEMWNKEHELSPEDSVETR